MRKRSRISLLVFVYGRSASVSASSASSASAATNQFRGVNWADSWDCGCSSTDADGVLARQPGP